MFPERVPGEDMFIAGPVQAMHGRSPESLQFTPERVRTRVRKLSTGATRTELVLRPKQEQLLQPLRDKKSMTPAEIPDPPGFAREGHTGLTGPVQGDSQSFTGSSGIAPAGSSVALDSGPVPLAVVRNPRARRYILRLRPDGTARVTVPRGGSAVAAREFVEGHRAWLEGQVQRLKANPPRKTAWHVGTEILLRGEPERIERELNGSQGFIRLGPERVRVPRAEADLRPSIECHLWRLAARELPPRVLAHASAHGLRVQRVTVRNQRTRWGSCSRRGTISLNWRVIQTPPLVQDYLCLHELMHLRQMNHSAQFWREVAAVCPDYPTAELWLKAHSGLLC